MKAFIETAATNQLQSQNTKTGEQNGNQEGVQALRPLKTIKLSDVKSEKINWLWNPFIPLGMFTLVDGPEGIGKSLAMLQGVGGAVATGKRLDTRNGINFIDAEPANVLLMSAEESLSLIVKPRLEAINAPCERFIAINEPLTLDSDGLIRVEMAIAEFEPDLVLIDPLFSYTGRVKLNDDSEIRSITGPLMRISEKFNCAIVGIRHLNKSKGFGDARNAGLNGVGWRASARSALLIGKDSETGETAIVQTKANLSPENVKALGYKIESVEISIDGENVSAPRLYWTGESALTAELMLSAFRSETTEEKSEKHDAMNFLRETLRLGQKLAQDVQSEARKVGISEITLRRAKAALRVRSIKDSFNGKWFWFIESAGNDQGGNDQGEGAQGEGAQGEGAQGEDAHEDAQIDNDERLRSNDDHNSNDINNIVEGAQGDHLRAEDGQNTREDDQDDHLRSNHSKETVYSDNTDEGAQLNISPSRQPDIEIDEVI